jgi:hypothetical protein
MNDRQYASPPCFLHEFDPKFLEIEAARAAPVEKKPAPAAKAETGTS